MLVKQELLLSIDLVAMWAIFVKNLMLPQTQNKNKGNCKNKNTNNKQQTEVHAKLLKPLWQRLTSLIACVLWEKKFSTIEYNVCCKLLVFCVQDDIKVILL